MWDNILFLLTVVAVAFVYLRLVLPKFGLRQ
jgi:hypothetical protein